MRYVRYFSSEIQVINQKCAQVLVSLSTEEKCQQQSTFFVQISNFPQVKYWVHLGLRFWFLLDLFSIDSWVYSCLVITLVVSYSSTTTCCSKHKPFCSPGKASTLRDLAFQTSVWPWAKDNSCLLL